MKLLDKLTLLLLTTGLPFAGDAGPRGDSSLPKADASLPPQIRSFCAEKERQARALAEKLKVKVAPDTWTYFQAARKGDWPAVSNLFETLKKHTSQDESSEDKGTVGTGVWPTVVEVQLAVEQFALGEPKYALAFGHGIIDSIPRGSIYFGGTDPGRGLVTALSKSHEKADPFFTLTQNALPDNTYLAYLREIYGPRIYVPSNEDAQKAFQDYLSDAQRRLEHDRKFPNEPRQIRPGEDVRLEENRVQVSGQVAVIAIKGLLTKVIFDRNPEKEFYIEESFPLDWMYPHLSPHGLIMKINREPLAAIPMETVGKDHEFWSDQVKQMIGGWLGADTSVKEVSEFVEKIFVKKDYAGFNGDERFVRNEYATKMFSKLRSAIGGLYQWRLTQAKDADERARMAIEADFAFRQAFSLCPYSPEATFRYVNLLIGQGRLDDALLIAGTAAKVDPANGQLNGQLRILVDQLNKMKAR